MMKEEKLTKTILIYILWGIIWLVVLWSIDHIFGLNAIVFDGISFALLLVISLLLKDIIFDFILEKSGYLPGWKSWYPWFEHLPLAIFLVILPDWIFPSVSPLVRAIALIDAIVDGYQDYQYRKI